MEDVYALSEQLTHTRKAIEKDSAVLQKKMRELGVEDAQRLKTMLNSAYLKLQANMLATKERIRVALVNRKFELATFERSARRVGGNGNYIPTICLCVMVTYTGCRREAGSPCSSSYQESRPRHYEACTQVQRPARKNAANSSSAAGRSSPVVAR